MLVPYFYKGKKYCINSMGKGRNMNLYILLISIIMIAAGSILLALLIYALILAIIALRIYIRKNR